jgi:radical SAM superfamily enzyme YgiQ (UPF0313 family)
MRILILQFHDPRSPDPPPVFSQSLGVLSALLKHQGMEVKLAALGGHQPGRLHDAIIRHRPKWIVAHLDTRTHVWARRNLVTVAERYQIPVLAVGQQASCKPRQALSIPGVAALIQGDYERAAARFLAAAEHECEIPEIPGLWHRIDGRLVKTPPAAPQEPDDLPFADRVIFDTAGSVQRTGTLCFSSGQGCPHWCAFCVNDWYMDLYDAGERFVRRRDVEDLLEEIAETTATYPAARRVRILNHAMAMDDQWLAAFSAGYRSRCCLELACHVRLNALSPRIVALLAEANCTSVHTQIGSGSDFIRNEILTMRTSEQQIRTGCELLSQAGIAVSADVFVGCPYETEITVEETVDLVSDLPLERIDAKVFYPLPGTRAAELCQDSGWISSRSLMSYWENKSVLDMPSLPAEVIDRLYRKFPAMCRSGNAGHLHKLLKRSRRRR